MLVTQDKILVHFHTNEISAYILKNEELELIKKESVTLDKTSTCDQLLEKVDQYLNTLDASVGIVDNTRVRLYATGIFQRFAQESQDYMVIHIYVNHGLYFNIVPPELEKFYLEKSRSVYGSSNIIHGLINQEFRRVVICGSFQQHLKEIGDIMSILKRHDIAVLSPWTTKIVPETIGTDFILLEGQEPLKNKRDAWKHKYIHMKKFCQSDAIIVCNPDGHIGQGTMFEFGFMIAHSKRVIFTDPPTDLFIPFPYEVGLNFK